MRVQKPKVKAGPYWFRLTKILTLRRRDYCRDPGARAEGLPWEERGWRATEEGEKQTLI